jgi:hypothetical protein
LSVDIVDAMSTVKELTPSPDGTAAAALDAGAADDEAAAGAEDEGAVDDVDDVDDEQPAAIRALPAARATQPSPLLLTSIPYPFHRNAVRSYTPMQDTAHHVCPYAMKGRSLGQWASSG